ncbi:glycosyltransferase [Peloplasma aerotolerans]|uniref:4,4'-diaponeurosporenoate glycosyltransferase n=1 Tax=Peloplasma aerotolerans TaxID=3044389 RepID=A0AAW6U719_9MOLU|nr:glycosyltransferase family 2 protein [Mariniplasma sp. M4Ah]MDI6453757.1 glycosyltransferase family 2 protein [Mariniplasma sp. M4Ah]MDR4968053.1 glycosyltransferase family 2 protein [Acholeplasmataceae bacterium]
MNWYSISLVVAGFLSSFYLYYRIPLLKLKTPTQKIPKISIIIPCRNEELSIGLLLNDLFNQSMPIHEIIVVDDGSTDQTGEIIDQFNVKKITVTEKNKEYVGKSWAIETGSFAATGELLLFLDADVRLSKDALMSLVALYEENHHIITVLPYHETKKHYEQFSIPFNLISIAANHTSTLFPKSIGCFGPCILIERKIYEDIGRHHDIRKSIIEDISLGILLHQKGYAFDGYSGNKIISYRMYPEDYKSLYYGWTKNIAFGALSIPILLGLTVFLFVSSILATMLELTLNFITFNLVNVIIYSAFYLIWMVRLYYISHQIGKFKLWPFLLLPITFGHFLFVFVVSFIKKIFKLSVKWKGRSIRA